MSLNFNKLIIFFFLIFILFINLINETIYIKSLVYIFTIYFIIYTKLKLTKNFFLLLIFLIITTFAVNFPKNKIIEKSSILKLNENNEIHYKNKFDKYYPLIKSKFINQYPDCFENYRKCFDNNFLKPVYVSIDQGFFAINKNISRKIENINFNSIDTLRPGFINDKDSRLNFDSGIKIKYTPYYIEYNNLPEIEYLCFKGNIIIYSIDTNFYESDSEKCININDPVSRIIGFQLGENELSIEVKSAGNYQKLLNYILILIFLFILFNHIDFQSLYKKNLFLNSSVAISTILFFLLIYYLSEYNPTNGYSFKIAQFNPLKSYYLMAQNMDGRAYLEVLYEIYNSYINKGFLAIVEGGNQIFWFNPGFRYFLVLEKFLFGDYAYLQLLIILLLPKIIYNYIEFKINRKLSNILIFLFLFYPFLILKFIFPNIHVFLNYYQVILHTFWGMSEPLALGLMLSGLYYYFSNYKKYYFLINILFFLAVLCKPHYLITVFILILIKFFSEFEHSVKIKSFINYLLVSILYFLPLAHNLYFGNKFIFITEYGQSYFNFNYILNNYDITFYFDRFINWKFFAMCLVLVLPKINIFNKIILITQYFSIFYFPERNRYEWLFILILFESYLIYLANIFNKSIKNFKSVQ